MLTQWLKFINTKCRAYQNQSFEHKHSQTQIACDLLLRKPLLRCFDQEDDGSHVKRTTPECEDAVLEDRNGFPVQKGGPPIPERSKCSTGWQFMLPFEFGLVIDFDVDVETNVPLGCGAINGSWIETR